MKYTVFTLLHAFYTWSLVAGSPATHLNLSSEAVSPSKDGCPSLVDGPVLSFVQDAIETHVSRGLYGCEKVLECRVHTSPPDVDIMWYRNGQLLGVESVRDVTMSPELPTDEGGASFLGLSELTQRLCADSLLAGASHGDVFQCRARSACSSSDVPAIEATPIRVAEGEASRLRRPGRSIRQFVKQWRRAPLITLATNTRMEIAGHHVQVMCRASGDPAPTIHWSVFDEETEREFTLPPAQPGELPFVWVTEKGDLLVDTSKTHLASITFVCRAVNDYGSDEQSSTIILLKDQEE